MNNLELEIKLLNVDVDKMKSKLSSIPGVKYKKEVIQKIYTYDCYDPIIMYELMLKDYKITKSKYSLKKLISYLKSLHPIMSDDDKKIINSVTKYSYLEDYISDNINNVDIKLLNDRRIKKVIKDSKNRFFKWIRLRQNGDKVELTVKYIYSVAKEYNIDDVKEIEIKVDSFEEANKLVEEMGYYHKKLVEKKRTTYVYRDTSIEIDEWPLIPAYIEIEGTNVNTIYDIANELGYKKEETKIMNTEDVFLDNGIDLNDYEILTFTESVKK